MGESAEMYLETILILGKRKNHVRAVDIANEMGISKASVSIALGKLKAQECVIVDQDGHIAFTEKGRAIAEKIYERHRVLARLIESLGVDPAVAAADACKVEHVISDETFAAIKAHVQRMDSSQLP